MYKKLINRVVSKRTLENAGINMDNLPDGKIYRITCEEPPRFEIYTEEAGWGKLLYDNNGENVEPDFDFTARDICKKAKIEVD